VLDKNRLLESKEFVSFIVPVKEFTLLHRMRRIEAVDEIREFMISVIFVVVIETFDVL
jgi:hypothetical protein